MSRLLEGFACVARRALRLHWIESAFRERLMFVVPAVIRHGMHTREATWLTAINASRSGPRALRPARPQTGRTWLPRRGSVRPARAPRC